MRTVRIKPFSKAYFDVMDQLPELRAVFALGDELTVVGRDRAIALADDDAADLTGAALSGLAKSW
jgi:hypothetical protein